jgi:hypothetical protein
MDAGDAGGCNSAVASRVGNGTRSNIDQQNKEAREKEARGQCKIVEWEVP